MDYVILDSSICNQKFYNQKKSFKENAVTTSYTSGRTTAFLANNRYQEQREVYLDLQDNSDNQELAQFWSWFTDTLGGLTGIFFCENLSANKFWRFTSIPEESEDLGHKTLTFNIEEAY